MGRVLVPMEHVKRCPQHDRAVSFEGTHLPHGLNIDRKPTFAQRRRDCLGYFLTLCRTVLYMRQELKLT